MKVLLAQQIKEADEATIRQQHISSLDLMERAAKRLAARIIPFISLKDKILILCGKGNNGGDGLVLCRLLLDLKYNAKAVPFYSIEQGSEDFQANYQKLTTIYPTAIIEDWNTCEKNLPHFTIFIDAIFGIGLHTPLKGKIKKIIDLINSQKGIKIAIDIPSGLSADASFESEVVFTADHTFTFEAPKLSFFLPSNRKLLGTIINVPIGLDKAFLKNIETPYSLLNIATIVNLIFKRPIDGHKGTFGHCHLLGGSENQSGSIQMAGLAALRVGCGLATVVKPSAQASFSNLIYPELMQQRLSEVLQEAKSKTWVLGPGMGLTNESLSAIEQILKLGSPAVIDADAITILASNEYLLNDLPPNCILTPHPGELKRLLKRDTTGDLEELEMARNWAKKHSCILLIKRAHTAIIGSDGSVFFNSTGNNGMATAGSGDVLSGIIAGLLCQGYKPLNAALLGVYLHGLAGDLAEKKKGGHSITASVISENIGASFKYLTAASE